MHDIQQITIYWPLVEPPAIKEEAYCYQFCYTYSYNRCLQSGLAINWQCYQPDLDLNTLLKECKASKLLLVANPKLLLASAVLQRLSALIDKGYSACGPIYFASSYQQQQSELPFVYLNLSSFEEVLELVQISSKEDYAQVKELDPACVLYARTYIQSQDKKDLVRDLNFRVCNISGASLAVEQKSLVHNFQDNFAVQRQDLIRLVPLNCKRVLDVGCATGEYGKSLKQKIPNIKLTGIEPNQDMAELAAVHYDRILVQQVQEAEFTELFDMINCGDVLEHLQDPWAVLDKLYSMLESQGNLVLSLPNAGHWTVVRDLLLGRFEYVPWGLLCITHVRWFTESSIREALSRSGFKIELFERQQIEPTPKGKEFIRKMVEQGLGDKTSLLSNEFLIRAYKQ